MESVDSVVVGLAFDPEQPATARTAIDTARTAVRRAMRTKVERGAFKNYDCTRPSAPTAVAWPGTLSFQERGARINE